MCVSFNRARWRSSTWQTMRLETGWQTQAPEGAPPEAAPEEAPEGMPVPDIRLHILLGDSIARRSRLRSRANDDQIFNRARCGATWTGLEDHLTANIRAWQIAAGAIGARPGTAIIWENGNELYSRYTQTTSFSQAAPETASGTTGDRVVPCRCI